MAKKASAKRSTQSKRARKSIPFGDKIINALMALLATRDFASISLADIADEAGVPLADLREIYDGKPAILADFSKRIDRTVLDGGPAEGETARDRLFDILMRRFDALDPYKDAVGNIMRAVRCDPGLACFAHRNATRSAKAMLAAADAGASGPVGAIACQGLVLVHAEVLRVWLSDDDPGLAKTMAALDRGLGRGEDAMKLVNGLCSALRPFICRNRETGDRRAAADA